MKYCESSANRKVHSTKCQHKENVEIYPSDLATHMKALENKETDSPRRSRQQEKIKLMAETNKIETKKTIE